MRAIELDKALISLSFVDRSKPAPGKASQQLVRSLACYFSGDTGGFATIALSLTTGSIFQQQIWHTLRQIPYGQTVSYRQVAETIGRPTAYRAVGKAIASNPLVIIVPCHRVIRGDGKIGGYVAGVERKLQLLELEGIITG